MYAVVVNVTINDPQAADAHCASTSSPASHNSPGSSPDTGRARTTPD